MCHKLLCARPHLILLLCRYPGGLMSELGGTMHAFLTDVLLALPADGSQAARWTTVALVPTIHLERFTASLAKMLEVIVGGVRAVGLRLAVAGARDAPDAAMCLVRIRGPC